MMMRLVLDEVNVRRGDWEPLVLEVGLDRYLWATDLLIFQ